MQKKLSKTPIIICCDRNEEQVRLKALIEKKFDNIFECKLNDFEKVLEREPDAYVIIGWLQPNAELRLIIEACRARCYPLLVVIKQLNTNDINRLPERWDYVLMPSDSDFCLIPWLEHAFHLHQSVQDYELKIQDLSNRLEERKLVEKAKGLLMKMNQVDEESAYRAMRQSAMKSSLSLGQVARNLLQTLEALE